MHKEWLEKIASDVEAKHGKTARDRIFGDIQAVPEEHADERAWFHRFISGMDELGDKDFLTAVLAERCPCRWPDFEPIIRDNYNESKTLEEFAERLARGNLIGDTVSLKGNVLTLTKQPYGEGKHGHTGPYAATCHCGLGSYTEKPITDIFCHCCTVGYYGKMFKNALGVDVKVVFKDSYLIGGKGCTADVYLPEKP